MVARVNNGTGLTMVVVRSKRGCFLTLIPQDLDAAGVDHEFRELGIDPVTVAEIAD